MSRCWLLVAAAAMLVAASSEARARSCRTSMAELIDTLFARGPLDRETVTKLTLFDPKAGGSSPRLAVFGGPGTPSEWAERARAGLSMTSGSKVRFGEHYRGMSVAASGQSTLIDERDGLRTPIDVRLSAVARYSATSTGRSGARQVVRDVVSANPLHSRVAMGRCWLRVTEQDRNLPVGAVMLRERRLVQRPGHPGASGVARFASRWIVTRSVTVPLSWLASYEPAPPVVASR